MAPAFIHTRDATSLELVRQAFDPCLTPCLFGLITAGDTLQLAKERARTLPLPEIPGFPDAPEPMRRIAALHRELQRVTDTAPHFCTAEDAREFAALKHKIEAHRIQQRLADDRLGVLRCVKPGDRHKGGKPTLWLYLVPIPPFQPKGSEVAGPLSVTKSDTTME
jgi:hypothetical protein